VCAAECAPLCSSQYCWLQLSCLQRSRASTVHPIASQIPRSAEETLDHFRFGFRMAQNDSTLVRRSPGDVYPPSRGFDCQLTFMRRRRVSTSLSALFASSLSESSANKLSAVSSYLAIAFVGRHRHRSRCKYRTHGFKVFDHASTGETLRGQSLYEAFSTFGIIAPGGTRRPIGS
jgi:hypothetical protein